MVQYSRLLHFILFPMLLFAFTGLLTSCTNTVPTVAVLRSKLENFKVEVSSTKTKLKVRQSANVTAVGGLAPYTFLVLENDQGSVDASGLYTAPINTSKGTKATVRAIDSLGNFAELEISIYDEVSVTASVPKMAVNNISTLNVVGGVPPYRFSVDSGGGTIDGAGVYTAPSTVGRYTVQATDSEGNVASVSLEVVEALQISPVSLSSVFFEQVKNFSANGGVPPYVFSVVSGGGVIDPATGAFTAKAPAGTTKVQVQDSLNNISEIDFSVAPAFVTIASPTEGSYINISNQGDFVVNGSCSDNGHPVTLNVVGQTSVTAACLGGLYTHTFDFSGILDGSVRVEVGQPGATSVAVTLQKDTMAPSLAFTSPNPGEAYSSMIDLQGTCDDNGQNITISVGTSTMTTLCSGSSFSHTLSLNFQDGPFTVSASLQDLAGNISPTETLNLIKDSVAPTAPSAITLSSTYALPSETPVISWSASTDVTTVVEHYIVEIYDSSNRKVASGLSYTTSKKITSLTLDENMAYTVKIRAVDSAENSSSFSVSSSPWIATANPCPTNYILVPAQAGSAVPAFCVSKFEMKQDPSGAVSVPEGLPWTLPRDGMNSATSACDNLGAGYELISNEQWNVIAKDIASVKDNWSMGSIYEMPYKGFLNRGHVFDDPNTPLAAIADDSKGCHGILACLDNQWSAAKRTHKLSNGNIIWDFSGNVWEWVKGSMVSAVTVGPVSQFTPGSEMQIAYGTEALCDSPESGSKCGYGRSALASLSYDGIARGGVYNYDVVSGVFAAFLGLNPGFAGNAFGFRCVLDPSNLTIADISINSANSVRMVNSSPVSGN